MNAMVRIHGSTYESWRSMRQRCYNPNSRSYAEYGGRGIVVCKEWDCFDNFKRDMGARPPECSLGRIDSNKGYFKENCRWETATEQQHNTRDNRWIEFSGKRQLAADWSRELGIARSTIRYRVSRGAPLNALMSKRAAIDAVLKL